VVAVALVLVALVALVAHPGEADSGATAMCAALPEQDAYVRHLQALQKVRDVCEGELNLPQICVVGDQSSGKSSLLACITGINFPVKSGICTKAPIVVECRSDTTVEKPIFELQDPGTKAYSEVNVDDLGGKVDKIQQAAVLKLLEGHDASKGEKPKISHEEIRVRVRGPEHIDIVVVDLPGMINAGDGKEASRELIRRYIKEEQTLILLVSEAKQDKELTSALDLAQEFDPRLIRTLRVLTKVRVITNDSQATSVSHSVRNLCIRPLLSCPLVLQVVTD
jgi:GTPase SAR1 family protein